MKKLIPILFMIMLLTGFGCARHTTKNPMASVPFFKTFVNQHPELDKLHRVTRENMIPTSGTERFEYTELGDGKYAACTRGGCTNYCAAIWVNLIEMGYQPERLEFLYYSIYNDTHPTHAIVQLTLDSEERLFFDSKRKSWVQTVGDYPMKWKSGDRHPPCTWFALVDDKWITTKF